MKFRLFQFVLFSVLFFSALSEAQRRTVLDHSYLVSNGMAKVAFFDADSTLRVSKSGSVSANAPDDVLILPFVAETLARLAQQGYLIAIVSNQGGVKDGIITFEIADQGLRFAISQIRARDQRAVIHYYDFAESYDRFRKPNIGMAETLAIALLERGVGIDWDNSLMVGDSAYKKAKRVKQKDGSFKEFPADKRPSGEAGQHFSNSDRLFAENIQERFSKQFKFYEPQYFFGWSRYGVDGFGSYSSVQRFYKTFPEVQSDGECDLKLEEP